MLVNIGIEKEDGWLLNDMILGEKYNNHLSVSLTLFILNQDTRIMDGFYNGVLHQFFFYPHQPMVEEKTQFKRDFIRKGQ